MSNSSEKLLESLINDAIKKVNASKENDLCRYLPGVQGGYIHHFTFKKMKTEATQSLIDLIQKSIISPANPKKLPHKPRAPRGSRKRFELINFSKTDIDRLMNMVRLSGDKDMIRKLMPKRDLRTIQRELVSSIRNGEANMELWNLYVEQVSLQNHAQNVAAAAFSM
jgi:hypothetical protein